MGRSERRMPILKTIGDNYSRQLVTIREGILFGLEECAGALATHNKMICSKRRMRRIERMINKLA